jgi:hypothetical protein
VGGLPNVVRRSRRARLLTIGATPVPRLLLGLTFHLAWFCLSGLVGGLAYLKHFYVPSRPVRMLAEFLHAGDHLKAQHPARYELGGKLVRKRPPHLLDRRIGVQLAGLGRDDGASSSPWRSVPIAELSAGRSAAVAMNRSAGVAMASA